MKLERRDNFKIQEKKLKKYVMEQNIYEKVIEHIKNCNDIKDLELSPISRMYGFEYLKHELNRLL